MNDSALLAHRLRAYINEFSTRADVHVHERTYCLGLNQKELTAIRKRLPADLAEFSAEMRSVRFIWDLADRRDEDLSPGVHGGRLVLAPLWSKSKFLRADPGYGFDEDTYFLMVDEHIAEGMSFLTYQRGEDPPQWQYVFGRAGEEGDAKFVASSFSGYLDRAMENAFTWYWPDGSRDGKSTLEYLRANPAKPRPVFEVKVKEWEPLSRADLRRRQVLGNIANRNAGKALKKLGVAVGKKESKEALAAKLVDHVIAMEALDDAAAEAIFDVVDYGIFLIAGNAGRTKDAAVKRALVAEHLAFGDEEPLARAVITVRPISTLPESIPGDPLGLCCLLLAQAPGSRVEEAIGRTRLWDYLLPAPSWPERRRLLRAIWSPKDLSMEAFSSGTVKFELAVPRALLPDLGAGTTWQATAVTR